jgi:hypothetical protein
MSNARTCIIMSHELLLKSEVVRTINFSRLQLVIILVSIMQSDVVGKSAVLLCDANLLKQNYFSVNQSIFMDSF